MLKNLQVDAFNLQFIVAFSMLTIPKYNLANIYQYKRSTLLQNITKLTLIVNELSTRDFKRVHFLAHPVVYSLQCGHCSSLRLNP